MNRDAIIELEDLIFKVKESPRTAAEITVDIIGVLIDLKSAMMGDFGKKEFANLGLDKLKAQLGRLGLEIVFFDNSFMYGNEMVEIKSFCISKDLEVARKTRDAFVELWQTMDDDGVMLDRAGWRDATKRIGGLLGYPKTAIDSFIEEDDVHDEERMKRMERNRYYAHSAEHEEEEFRAYDQKLNRAVSDLAPKTAKVLTRNKKKRWLE